MKTSKRFLSIVLMLAMLVSMFTVMAFADDKATLTFIVTGPGHIEIKKTGEDTKTVTDTLTMRNVDVSSLKDCIAVAVPNENSTGKLYFGDIEISGDTVGLGNAVGTHIISAVFTATTSENPEAECKHPKEKITYFDAADGYSAYGKCECGKYFATWGNGVYDTAHPKDSKEDFKLKPVNDDTAYDLTVVISGRTHGSVYYKNGNNWERVYDGDKLQNIVAGTDVKFSADADSGYYVKWTYGSKDTYDDTKTVTVKKTSTLYVKFIADSSSSHTHNWEQKFNKTYHWDECSKCGDIKNKEKHTIKTKTDKYGYSYDYCKYCDWTSNYTYDHTSSHKDYTYEDINATYHWKTCKKCDYSVKEYHTWIKNTDRKTKDSYPYVCKYCDRLSKTAYTDLPFRDVDGNVWYYDDVLYAYINGYMDGLSAGQFAPNQNTTRAQIVTILWRLTGEPRAAKSNKFNDVSSTAYYDKAVSWAVEAGVVNGFDAKTFKPNDYVTREQLAAILYRYAEYMNVSTRGASNLTKYDDYYQIGTWARDAMAWANYHGLINGVSYTRIDPKGYATRAQVAAILHRFAVEFGNY